MEFVIALFDGGLEVSVAEITRALICSFSCERCSACVCF